MSALPPKADMCGATRDARFVPIADIRGLRSKCLTDQQSLCDVLNIEVGRL